ncbi:tRNA (cytidine(34)-2'-O)-methyltransferase [Ureaplasma canigenitalium]|uniref:tRNA (cytidine(34)-2'-O)-methyltransferase n=1 Tax=Ureaplasma canigenitalium TaxID=42092 RepID=UPI0004E23282|nr:tRNA (cytidine(34)-2'-O)-methyltransferase [Ureaplasma canigenitalium]
MIHVVLFQPEIVLNVGNISRITIGFNCKLHLIRPYGFIFDKDRFDKDFIRSSANHFDVNSIFQYNDFDEFIMKNNISPCQLYLYTRYGSRTPADFQYPDYKDNDIYLVFGKESTGIDHDILRLYQDRWVRVPMSFNLRSMNIGNTVAIAVYEVLRQHRFNDLLKFEPHKDFD